MCNSDRQQSKCECFLHQSVEVPWMQYVDKCEYFYSLVIVQHIQVNERGGSFSLTLYWFEELVIL
jgi:hypothetical protein